MKRLKKNYKSAYAVLLYRYTDQGDIEIFLCLENGPRYWEKTHDENWGLPKGRATKNEEPFETAQREFEEEIGLKLPGGNYWFLTTVTNRRKRKTITVFAGFVVPEVKFMGSHSVTKQWPPQTGNYVTYPEILTARWVPLRVAEGIILPTQKPILKAFKKAMKKSILM